LRKAQGTSVPVTPPEDLATRIERMPSALTARQLFTIIGMSKTAFYDRVTRGEIPYFRLGTVIRFDPVHAAAWLRAQQIVFPREATHERRAA
jgi:predicted DNA-binding transcriptional regulator AlpA